MATNETKARANSIMSVTREDGKLVFTVANVGRLVFDPDRVSAENRARAMMHGFEQRIRDAAALSRDTATGASATPAEKAAEMKRVIDHLESGGTEWALRVSAKPRGPDTGAIIVAMIRAQLAADVDAGNALLDRLATKRGIDRDTAARVFASTPQVVKALAEIAAEASPVNADDLIAEAGEASAANE